MYIICNAKHVGNIVGDFSVSTPPIYTIESNNISIGFDVVDIGIALWSQCVKRFCTGVLLCVSHNGPHCVILNFECCVGEHDYIDGIANNAIFPPGLITPYLFVYLFVNHCQ